MKENKFLTPLGFDDMFDWRSDMVGISDPFVRMRNQVGRLLAAIDGEFATAGHRIPPYSMRMDAFVKDGKFNVVTDMPGLSKEDIEVSLHDGFLSISGERKSERKDEKFKGEYYLNERSNISFSRTISLPEGVDSDKADVEFKAGVLSISMPIKVISKPEIKKLTIK